MTFKLSVKTSLVNIGIFVRQSATLSLAAVERTVNTSYMVQTQSEYDLYRLSVCMHVCMFACVFVYIVLGKKVFTRHQLCKLSNLKRWEWSNVLHKYTVERQNVKKIHEISYDLDRHGDHVLTDAGDLVILDNVLGHW